MEQIDIVIIGAGPAGISAALYLKRAGASFVWLEKGAPGGKLINIHEVGNYPGIPNANGFDLAMSLLKSTESVNASVTYGEVKSVQDTIAALGLRKIGQTKVVGDNPAIRGMIFKVRHMVSVKEVKQENDYAN